MSHRTRPRRASTGKAPLRILRGLAGVVALSASLFGFVDPAQNPVFGPSSERLLSLVEAEPRARLRFDGGRPLIEGSVAALFSTKVFDEPLPDLPDGQMRATSEKIALARTFTSLRVQIARLKTSRETGIAADADRVEFAALSEEGIAALGPADYPSSIVDRPLAIAALAAIDAVTANTESGPAPLPVPTQLAYARANAPATQAETPSDRVSKKEMNCLTTAIYFEARGESFRGQVAVGQVVLNRVKHPVYPSTICGVVYQNQHRRNACQFSFACDGIPERVTEASAWRLAEEIARKVIDGTEYVQDVANATHYHAKYVRPHWAPRLRKMTSVGLHIFYRFKSS